MQTLPHASIRTQCNAQNGINKEFTTYKTINGAASRNESRWQNTEHMK